MSRSLFLAAYDVRDPKRLRHALRVVRQFASGGQRSAYECWLTTAEAGRLMADISLVIDHGDDSFALIPLDPRRGVTTLGVAEAPADPDFYYFG